MKEEAYILTYSQVRSSGCVPASPSRRTPRSPVPYALLPPAPRATAQEATSQKSSSANQQIGEASRPTPTQKKLAGVLSFHSTCQIKSASPLITLSLPPLLPFPFPHLQQQFSSQFFTSITRSIIHSQQTGPQLARQNHSRRSPVAFFFAVGKGRNQLHDNNTSHFFLCRRTRPFTSNMSTLLNPQPLLFSSQHASQHAVPRQSPPRIGTSAGPTPLLASPSMLCHTDC